MKIYLIPGLGFDYRIFQNLDFGDFKVEYINWIEPLLNEHLQDYSKRLFENKWIGEEKIVLIGHSLGGIVAQEIASVYNIEKVILISSIKSEKENPLHFSILKPLGIYKIFTKEICISTIKYWGKNHGFETNEDQELFKSMLKGQSNKFLQWALKSLAIWKSPTLPTSTKIVQISGEKDKNFPIKFIKTPNYKIENGNHNMVYKQPEKLNKILIDELIDL
jgi:pimeloyl-ACP methyl ester carboxylesterase